MFSLIYSLQDSHFTYCLTNDDLKRVWKISCGLKVFKNVTNMVSSSDYPTSILFLKELCRPKMVLNNNCKLEKDWLKEITSNIK